MPILGNGQNGFESETVSVAQASGNVLPPREASTHERFIIKIHENNWIFKYDQWLPDISKIILSPGINGVDERDTSAARSMALEKGYTIIDNENNRLSQNFKAYLKRTKSAKGFAYHMCFEYPELFRNKVNWKCDEKMELDFLLDVKEKYIPVVDPRIVDEAISDAKRSLGRLKDAASRGRANIYEDRIKMAEEKLKKMIDSKAALNKTPTKNK